MATTRATLRRSIGRLCGDLIVATATAVGSTTTFTDSVNLVAGEDVLIGRQAYYVTGHASNVGTLRRISANDELGTFTVSTAWAQASALNDVVELYASRSVSPTPTEIHDKINDVIRAIGESHLSVVDDATVTFDMDDPYIDIPAGWIGITDAFWTDTQGIRQRIPKADRTLHRYLGSNGQIELTGVARAQADSGLITLVGVTAASELTTDADTTSINPDYITKQAAGELLIQNSRIYEDTASAERKGNLWLQQAASLLPRAQARPPANFQRLNRA